MKTLSAIEVGAVSGGLCENMSIAQCIDGSGSKAASEIAALVTDVGTFLGETAARFVMWCQD
jgi:hypothetical protein